MFLDKTCCPDNLEGGFIFSCILISMCRIETRHGIFLNDEYILFILGDALEKLIQMNYGGERTFDVLN